MLTMVMIVKVCMITKEFDSPMSVQSAAYENGGTSNTSATYKSDTTSRNKAYLKLVYEQYKSTSCLIKAGL